MTRKKSNVKALALAVTCAILAGGYSGLNPVYADDLTINLPASGTLTLNSEGNVTGSITIGVSSLTNVLDNNLSNVRVASGGITLGALVNNVQSITYDNTATPSSPVTKISTKTIVNGEVQAESLMLSKDNKSSSLDIESLGKLNQLVASSSVDKPTITAGDGSTVGGVGFNNGAVTGVKSINASDSSAKFKVTQDDSKYTFRAGNLQITTGKETDTNGQVQLNGKITFADTNRPGSYDITLEEIAATRDKTASIGHFTGSDSSDSFEGTSIENKLKVYKDGKVTIDGTLTAKSGSKIGNITIDGGQLVAPLSGGTDGEVRVNVTDLAADHDIITNDKQDTYSSKTVKSKIDSLETSEAALTAKTQAIGRVLDDSNNPVGTAIENKLRVYNNGTVTINEGEAQQVTIDSNGIKVGKNSSRMNDSYGFATTRDLYVGADSADAPTKDGSKFYVDGSSGDVVSKGSVTANQAGFNDLAVTNGLTVGDNDPNGKFVNMQNGSVVATGSVTAMGDLAAVGNLYVSGKSTFTNGVKTNKIEEATTDAGVTVDGVLLKDGGISAADGKFTVNADGAVSAAGGKFGVDKDGNTNVGGTLNVNGATTLGGTLNVTGDTTLGGNLGVTGNATVDGTLNSKGNFSVGTNNEFTVDATNGNVVSKGSLTSSSATIGTVGITNTGVITGVSSLTTDALIVNGALNINGDITGKNISGDSLAVTGNGTIGGSLGVTGAITGATINGATITTDSFNGATIKSNKFNGVTLDNNGNISGQDINASGNINANGTINGATITNNSFNGVTMTSGNVTGATITGTTITDGAGASMNAGTVKGTTITDGNGFTATGGNVSAKDVTATGTVQGMTVTDGIAKMNGGKVTAQNGVEVDANNYLKSSGLKTSNIDASKATIGKIKIEGSQITSTEADGTVGLAGITVNNAGALNNVTSIDGVSVGAVTGGNGLQFGGNAVIGATNKPFSSTGYEVDGEGNVKAKSFKVNDSNYLDSTGLTTEAATIGDVNKLDNTGIDTSGKLHVGGQATFGDSTSGNYTTVNGGTVTVEGAAGNKGGKITTIAGGKITTDTLDVQDIVLRNQMKDGAGNTITISGTDGSLSVASGAFTVDKDGQLKNKITGTEGGYTYETNLETSKSGINANYTNTVNGNNNLLAIDKDGVALGVTDSTNQKLGGFAANKDNASLSYGANNSIVVDANKITSALGTDVSTTLTNNGADQSIVNKVTDNATSTIKVDSIVNKVGSAKRSLKADEIVDEAAGMTVKTNNDGTLFTNGTTSTLINGSKLTSTNGSATGVLDGSNLTLTNGTKSTALEAGKVTYTGAAGSSAKHGTTTTIDGGTITTDTLKVERIELGENLIDTDGNATNPTFGANLSMDKQGNFSAAGGKFTVTGTNDTEGNIGAITNSVGGTKFSTNKTGAGMSFNNNPTEPSSGITSNVSVGNNNANVSAGAGSIDVTNKSITSKVTGNATSTITKDSITDKVGGTTVETKDGSFSVNGKDVNGNNVGMNIDTTTGKTTFTGADYNGGASGTTTIDGNTITTGKLITDKLVIKGNGSGDTSADGGDTGSIAFGGDGTITSNIKDGANETTFKTTADGVSSEVTNGTYTSNVDQGADRIGSVITGGNVKIGSVADASLGVLQNGAGTVNADGDTVTEASQAFSKDGSITSVAKDADGSSKLVQNGTGLEYTDSAKADNATRINSSDISIGSATDDSKRINLSDLGQIDDLDSELSARDEFTSNKTAVGGINAEAAARREEVARLDNRIDDVNNRVDKVGAMAAAIASLKSIGYDPQAPSEFSVGLGQYKGETGVALGFFHYPNKNFMINVSLSTAGGETMGGIGATWRFGHKSPQKLLDEQREAQARKELAAAEKYKAAAQLAKEAQERAEYAAKLARQAQVSADNAKAAADATQAKHFNK